MRIVLTVLMVLMVQSLWAQPGNRGGRPAGMNFKGSIKGIVQAKESRKPIEYATISLMHHRDSSFIGGVTNAVGVFNIDVPKPGKYEMLVSFIGFTDITIPEVIILPKEPNKDMGLIYLSPGSEMIDKVEVIGERNLIEVGIDRKTYNVEKDITAKGSSALEVLENIPSIEVDQDNNITLRGSGGVRILIDGRPAETMGDVSAYLESLPGSALENVEIITNPSAKFDPEGQAGIININLKKTEEKGFNGSVMVYGSEPRGYGGSFNLNYRTPRANWYIGHNMSDRSRVFERTNVMRYTFPDTNYYLEQENSSTGGGLSNFSNGGVDFYLSDKTTLGISGRYGITDGIGEGNDEIDYFNSNYNYLYSVLRYSESNSDRSNYSGNLYLRKLFPEKSHELMFDFNYKNSESENNDEYVNSYSNGFESELQNTGSTSESEGYTAQIDYTYPDDLGGKFETGYKFENRSRNQDFQSNSYNQILGNFEDDTALNYDFLYTSEIHSIYGIYSKEAGTFGYMVGMRLEQAKTTSELVGDGDVFENPYVSLFPSAHLSLKTGEFDKLQLSYSRRIRRPGHWELNPFSNYSDPNNIFTGNPFLKPEYTHSMELGFSTFKKKGSFVSSVYYRHTTDLIRRFKTVEESGVSYITFFNFNTSDDFGAEVSVSYRPTKWWRINASSDFYRSIVNGENVENDVTSDGYGMRANLRNNFELPKDISIQLAGGYRSPFAIPQGEILGSYHIDGGISKQFLNKQATVSLNVRDAFNTRRFKGNIESDLLFQEFDMQWRPRSINLALNYRFGKQYRPEPRKKDNHGGTGNNGGESMGF